MSEVAPKHECAQRTFRADFAKWDRAIQVAKDGLARVLASGQVARQSLGGPEPSQRKDIRASESAMLRAAIRSALAALNDERLEHWQRRETAIFMLEAALHMSNSPTMSRTDSGENSAIVR